MKQIWKKLCIVILLALTVSWIAGCGGAAAPSEELVQYVEVSAEQPLEVANRDIGQPDQGGERIVIKNANMTIVVTDPAQSLEQIGRMAEEMGGFIVNSDLSHTELNSGRRVPRGVIMIRVPAERLTEAMERIRAESDQAPLTENINSQDVTSEYTDLQSRLHNEEAAEAQLVQIMEQANRTEDVLNVYNQLIQVRERIEVIKGQIKYYEESAALSSITTELLVDEAVQPLTVGGWQLGGVAKTAVQTLIDTLRFLADAVIWIVLYLLPVLLVLFIIFVLPVLLIVRYFRRRKARRRVAAQVNEQESTKPGA